MLAVLAVLVAVTTFAIPDISGDSVDAAARRIASACERGRALALQEGVRVRLVIDVQAGEYRLLGERDPENAPGEFVDLDADGSNLERLPEGVRFGDPEIGPLRFLDRPAENPGTVSIEFDPDGTADAAVLELVAGSNGDREQRRFVVLDPLTGKAVIALERPPVPEDPAQARAAGGVAGDKDSLLDLLLNYGNGLGGQNPNQTYNPRDKLGQVTLTEEDEEARGEPAHGLLPTVPGR